VDALGDAGFRRLIRFLHGDEPADLGGHDSESEVSDFDIEAEQLRENEAAYSDMQLQADSDRLQADLDQRIDPGGSDLSGGPDPGGPDSEADFDIEAEQMREYEAIYSDMQLRADSDRLQADLDQRIDPGGSDLSGGPDPGGPDSEFDSDFDIEAEQMREYEAIYSDMQLQADSDRLQADLDQRIDPGGSDLSGNPDPGGSDSELDSDSDREEDELHNDQLSDSDQLSDHDHNSGQFSDQSDDRFSDGDQFSLSDPEYDDQEQDELHNDQLSDSDQLGDYSHNSGQFSDRSDDRFSDGDQFSDPEYEYDDHMHAYDDELRSDSGGPDD
jgi:hypothetical protein